MKEWQLKIQAVYLNSKQHMKNTPEDWEKVFGSFNKILKDYNNDPLVNDEIQKAIIQLEEYLREVKWGYGERKLSKTDV